MPLAHQRGELCRPRRLRESLRGGMRARELIEWQPQAAGARIARQSVEHLELAQRPAEGAAAVGGDPGEREAHQRLDERRAPALAIRRQLATGVEGGRRQIPQGRVDESAECGEGRETAGREARCERAAERMRWPSLRAALALIAPPAEAYVRDLVVEPGAQARGDFALDAA